MGWKTHVAAAAIRNRIPFGNALRRLKRRLFGYAPDDANLRTTLGNFDEMRKALAQVGRSFVDATVFEIGSGWFPTIPVMLSAAGARKVIMSDVTPHLDKGTLAAALAFVKPHFEGRAISEASNLADLRLDYLAPFDAALLEDASLDVVVSRTVLEHIPPDELRSLLILLRPKLAATGVMVHCVDHSDHLEHRDKSISRINFLTWSNRRHRFVNWLLKGGENRLRHHEYLALFDECGYDVVVESGSPHRQTLELAESLSLSERFAGMTAEQVSILSSIFVLVPRRPGAVGHQDD